MTGPVCLMTRIRSSRSNDDVIATPALPQFNEAAMAQLEAMGFPTVRCQKALLATGNSDPEAAMEWLFAHMEDPGTSLLLLSLSGDSLTKPARYRRTDPATELWRGWCSRANRGASWHAR